MRPAAIFALIWIGWFLSWMLAAAWSGKTEKRVYSWDAWVSRLLMVAGGVLIFRRNSFGLGGGELWHVGDADGYALAGVTLAGAAFAWWARIHLGSLWSGSVTLKRGHRVIDTVPYRVVRHPIYTGLLLAASATVAAAATAQAVAGLAVVLVGVFMKARVEEHLLAAELGPDAYGAYQRRVPMLVPFLPMVR
jgi:protein-S-isoprenylcysteine O-methyltransferase Ste14